SPTQVGGAEREKRLDVGVRMPRVPAILDEAVLVVQVANRLAILQPPQAHQQVVVAHRVSRAGPRPRDGSRTVFPEPSANRPVRNVTGDTPAKARNSAFMCAWS